MTAPEIDVVVPVLNAGQQVLACLAALRASAADSKLTFRAYVVDDGSTDDTQRWLQTLQGEDVRILTHRVNRGRAAARNTGAAQGSARYLMFVDVDCRIRPECLGAHIACLENGADVSVGLATGHGPGFWGKYLTQLAQQRAWLAARGDTSRLATPNVMLRRSVFSRVGGYDEAFTRYGFEDRDLLLRIEREGIALQCNPGAMADMSVTPDLRSVCHKMESAARFSAPVFMERHTGEYLASVYAGFDARLTGVGRYLLLRTLGLARQPLLGVAGWMTRTTSLPFPLVALTVQACEALAYFEGSRQADSAIDGKRS